MKLGFNSNLQLPDAVYHVQTEEHGAGHPSIDTLVLRQGQVLYRHTTSYHDLLANGRADQTALLARVERQHRDILHALQEGSLQLDNFAPQLVEEQPLTVEIKVHNLQTSHSEGRAALEVEVCSRSDGRPVVGAEIAAEIEGGEGLPQKIIAQTNARGRARLQFSLPESSNLETAAVVIHALTPYGRGQLRFRLKPKTNV
jgi:hypothetical protein